MCKRLEIFLKSGKSSFKSWQRTFNLFLHMVHLLLHHTSKMPLVLQGNFRDFVKQNSAASSRIPGKKRSQRERQRQREIFVCMYVWKKIKERERDHVDCLGNGIESIGCLSAERKQINSQQTFCLLKTNCQKIWLRINMQTRSTPKKREKKTQ